MNTKINIGKNILHMCGDGIFNGKLEIWGKMINANLELKDGCENTSHILKIIQWINSNKEFILESISFKFSHYINIYNSMVNKQQDESKRCISEEILKKALYVNYISIYIKSEMFWSTIELASNPDYLLGTRELFKIDCCYNLTYLGKVYQY